MHKLFWKGECIDEFDTLAEAQAMKAEYNLAYGGGVTIRSFVCKITEKTG